MKRTTSALDLLVRLDRRARAPLRLQLEGELRRAIQNGRLVAGALLPSTRSLAADLGVSRGVVVEAYEQLLAEGYVIADAGSATRVAARRAAPASAVDGAAPPAPEYRYDFRPGLPDLSLFPRRAWMTAMRRALATAPHGTLDYPQAAGVESARVALSHYLNRARATVAHPERVVFCNGSAQGIGLLCRVLRARGARRIAVEDPGHADQCTDIQASGLETPRIRVDEEGLLVERLARIEADAILVTPAHQYPTGAVLSAERRAALLDWSTRRRALIIEDDYDAEYRYDRHPIGALQGLSPDRVVYVGSASKVLSPALRLGWLVAPADLAVDVARAKLEADRGSPALEQLAFTAFLEQGDFDRHLRRTRAIYRQRRDRLVAALRSRLPRLSVRGVAAGLHVMVGLEPDMDERAIVQVAARRSMRLYGAGAYHARPADAPPALVLGYGGLPEETIDDAVRELAVVLREARQKSDTGRTSTSRRAAVSTNDRGRGQRG